MRALLVYTDAPFYDGTGYDEAWRTALTAQGAQVDQIAGVPEAWHRSGPPADLDLVVAHVLVEELVAGGDTLRAATLLEQAGVPLLNSVAALTASADKLVAHALWAARGLPQPQTWALDGLEAWPADGEQLVLKPAWGDGARDIELVGDLDAARALADGWAQEDRTSRRKRGPAMLQERVVDPDVLRLFATPERCSTAYEKSREPGALVTHGTTYPVQYEPDAELAGLAQAMVAAVGGGLMGVDVLRDRDGRLLALEANGPFGFDVTDHEQGRWIARAALDHGRSSARPAA